MDMLEKFNRTRDEFSGLVDVFRHDEEGATAIEYGLIVALIFLAIVGAVRAFTNSASDMYDEIDQTLQNS